MAQASAINAQLSRLGVRPSRWFRAELRELEQILHDDEAILAFASGRYFGGLAILVATEHRLILVDKKPMFLAVEDIRYDMISEVNYSARMMASHMTVFTINKQHSFSVSFKNRLQLRHLTYFVQQKILRLHQNLNIQDNMPESTRQGQQQADKGNYRVPQYRSTHHVSQTLGAIANKATSATPNPFAKNQMIMRRRWSRF